MNGPSAQLAVLSFALERSRAERPSKSRRFTSLPRHAPTTSPAASQTSTTSGSGLFQSESERTPISAPCPTDDRTGLLEKISASGPMATSRYCDHMPSSMRTCFNCAASSLPGTTERMPEPTFSSSCARMALAAAASPRARSSITRSMADKAKVTPLALIHWRSIGLSKRQPSGNPSATGPISRPPPNALRATTPATLALSCVSSNSEPPRMASTTGPSGVSARPRNCPSCQSPGRHSIKSISPTPLLALPQTAPSYTLPVAQCCGPVCH